MKFTSQYGIIKYNKRYEVNMGYTTDIKSYMGQIMTDVLPSSSIEQLSLNRIGLHSLNYRNAKEWNTELRDSSALYPHEKCTPKRLGVRQSEESDEYSPLYFRYYQDSMLGALGKIIVNSALEIYPTPVHPYGTIYEGVAATKLGVSTIDLNHLIDSETGEPVENIRLDFLLHSLGLPHEINSFYDFQKMLESGKLADRLTPRAIVQLGLSSIFIPNAIGEVDANSRNVILFKDPVTNKYDIVARIDAEANTYLNDAFRQRSGKKVVPKGIFSANEEQDEFLQTIRHRDLRVDWDLFTGFTSIAKKLCSRSNIDNAITKAYMKNSGKLVTNIWEPVSPYLSFYNSDAFFDFSESTITRAGRFFDNVDNAIGYAKRIPPFAEATSKYGNISITDQKLKRYIQQKFDSKGRLMGR